MSEARKRTDVYEKYKHINTKLAEAMRKRAKTQHRLRLRGHDRRCLSCCGRHGTAATVGCLRSRVARSHGAFCVGNFSVGSGNDRRVCAGALLNLLQYALQKNTRYSRIWLIANQANDGTFKNLSSHEYPIPASMICLPKTHVRTSLRCIPSC